RKIDLGTASIREVNRLVSAIEAELSVRFVRMEFGIPGLPVHPLAVEAEGRALRERGISHVCAPFDGVPALKPDAARCGLLVMTVEAPPSCCIPTIGAMEGCFASLALAAKLRRSRPRVLFLDPGFPVNRLQARFLGLTIRSLDFYHHRGTKLLDAVEALAAHG